MLISSHPEFLICYQPHVFVVAIILYCFDKIAVVYGLEEALFKLVGACVLSLAFRYIIFKPHTLHKVYHLVHFLNNQFMFQSLIESSNVHHMLFFVADIWHQLIHLVNRHLFYHKRQPFVNAMQLLWVIQIHFMYVAMLVFLN